MDPVRELPYWPAAKALHIEAGQMAASDYVPTYPHLLLASEGVSTDAVQSFDDIGMKEREVSGERVAPGKRHY